MSVTTKRQSAYIMGSTDRRGASVDREAQLHLRRKQAIKAVTTEFERLIEPLLPPGHEVEIEEFKRICRGKLNSISFRAIELLKLKPGESFNEAAAELAEQVEFDANGGTEKP